MKKRFVLLVAALVLLLSVSIIFANDNINITQGNFPIRINGIKQPLDTFNINDSTYISLRELCNITDMDIEWNEAERTIEINTDKESHMKEELGIPLPTTIGRDAAIKIADAVFVQAADDEILSDKYILNVSESSDGAYYRIYRYPEATFGGQLGVLISKKDGQILGFGLGD